MNLKSTVRSCRRCGFSGLIIQFFLVLLLGLLLLLPVSASSFSTDDGDSTITATINEKKTGEIVITLTADRSLVKAYQGQQIYLLGSHPYESSVKVSDMTMLSEEEFTTKTVFRITDDGERRFWGFCAAVRDGDSYKVLSDTVYVSNPDVLAQNNAARSSSASIKGLNVSGAYLNDALSLGISHAVIAITLDDWLSPERTDYSYTCGSGTTYFDAGRVEALDEEIAILHEHGVQVLFRFLLNGDTLSDDYYPSSALYSSTAVGGASFYGISIATKDGYSRACAAFLFFANRYCADDDVPVTDFILGYQVNESSQWNNLGNLSGTDLISAYADVFRLADSALRSVSSNSRVYVPLSNLFVSAKRFLSTFNEELDGGAWNVAVSPYASSPLSDAIWEDSAALDTTDSSFLTMKNLTVLKEFLTEKQYQYSGKLRGVIIDDFAVNGTGAEDSLQSVSLAYAYYRAACSGFVDAFIYHRICDSSEESAQYGLRTENGTAKDSYELYRCVDTSLGSTLTSDYPALMGVKNWSAAFKNCNVKKAETVTLYEGEAEKMSDTDSSSVWFDFTDGLLHGFAPNNHVSRIAAVSINASGTSIHDRVLQITACSLPQSETASVIMENKLDSTVKQIIFTVKATGISSSVPLTLQIESRHGSSLVRYVAEATISPDQWETVSFPVGSFLSDVGSVSACTLSFGTDGSDAVLSVNEVSAVRGSGNLLAFFLRLLLILVVLVVALVLALLIWRKIRRARRRRLLALRRAKQQEAERRRRIQSAKPSNPAPAEVRKGPQDSEPVRHHSARRTPEDLRRR